MIQYMSMTPYVILNKDGERRKVDDFRKRVKYDAEDILITNMTDEDFLRIDVFCNRMYGNAYNIGPVIDVNPVDYFSKDTPDELLFVNPNVIRRGI